MRTVEKWAGWCRGRGGVGGRGEMVLRSEWGAGPDPGGPHRPCRDSAFYSWSEEKPSGDGEEGPSRDLPGTLAGSQWLLHGRLRGGDKGERNYEVMGGQWRK